MAEEKEARLIEELQKMQYDPWLPIESKLVKWSIGLGIVLLIVLVWVSYTFFPSSHG
ncbi:MAG TPA: hypothetical protein DIT22_07925 [Thermodesulfobacterium commune]|jgi:hypothetical protein|uniref:hypothetical protein n=1 Tax=Thermodesulfobacterium commune TaxID=1741 RepID=UPI000EBACB12|nr:hypothetical protein [Thermodesulfobacterium sp.]HCE79314.1 hypothetical protein [Thermodesulfobacterium commune]HCP10603.1 hypothetical protein [Thermodesulfobacterium commune]